MKKNEKKKVFVEPKVLASYKKEDLEEIIKPHGGEGDCTGGACGTPNQGGGGGCGCGGGSILGG
jgi:hypothetical protein